MAMGKALPRKKSPYLLYRVPWLGIEYDISRINKSERDMCYSFL
jgi:hypothetical protein